MIYLKIRDIQYEKASRKDFAKVGDFIETFIQIEEKVSVDN